MVYEYLKAVNVILGAVTYSETISHIFHESKST